MALQSTVVIPLLPWMVLLIPIKTQLRVLRYCSCVTQCLCQLGGRQQYVQQMGDGLLTLLVLFVHVSIHLHYVNDITMLKQLYK